MNMRRYRTGRESLGVLAGRRTKLRSRQRLWSPVRSPTVILAIAALFVAVVAVGGREFLDRGSLQPGHQPSITAATPPVLDLLAGGAAQHQVLPAIESRFSDWREAQAAVDFPVKQPGWLPAAYRLSALQGFVATLGQQPLDVIATFNGPNRALLILDQVSITQPDKFDFERSVPSPPADINWGRLTVDANPAYWMHGVSTWDDAGEPLGWDGSVLVLAWQADNVFYRLDASAVDLATLVKIAESLKGP